MFSFFKKKKNSGLKAPIDGKCIDIESIEDEVFSKKMMGDGVAIDSTGDILVAPADGKITFIAETKHAFSMTMDNGMELLIHCGLDTVNFKGEGFEVLVELEKRVSCGTPIIKVDRKFFEGKKVSLVTPMVILNYQEYKLSPCNLNLDSKAGKTDVLKYE